MGVYNQIMRVCLEVCLVLVVMTAVQGCLESKKQEKTCTRNSQCERNQRCKGNICQYSNHVNGNWGGWHAWTQCSVTCGRGYRTRTIRCDNPAPSSDGDDCYKAKSHYGNPFQRKRGCNAHACPVTVDASVSTWGVWGACSTTCGGGSWSRSRSCVPPRNGGRRCPTKLTSISQCNTNQCPVHGNWGRWHQITKCSGPCGRGTLQRVRSCDKPSPMFGGHECRGERDETRACNRRGCPGVG